MRWHQHEQAFTLIEVLVSIAILAILSALIYGTFSQSHALSTRFETTAETYRALRPLFKIMLDELDAAYYLEPSGPNPTPDTVFIGKSPDERETLSASQSLLRFTTLDHRRLEPDSPESNLGLVEYQIRRDPASGLLTLLHREETNLLSTTEASMEEYELAEGIKELSVRFFDGTDWADSWDSTAKKDLPQAVEIKFVVPIEKEDRTFSFLARIPSAKPFVTGVIKPRAGGGSNP